jgi:hypothetical protein
MIPSGMGDLIILVPDPVGLNVSNIAINKARALENSENEPAAR